MRRAGARARLRRAEDEGMAMMVVVCCLMVAAGVAVTLLGVLFSELTPTSYERKAERTIAGSQAGLQVGLAAVRQASAGTSGSTIVGDRAKLPCYTAAAPLLGQVDGLDPSQAPVKYMVRVQYFTIDPSGQSDAWRTANELPCTPGSGTATAPVYALVRSLGYSASGQLPAGWGDRSTEVVYSFNRTDQAELGGLIHTDTRTAPSTGMCWAAATYPVVAGTQVQLAPCSQGDPAQTWSYRTDYSIVLSSTQSTTSPPSGGLCVDTSTLGGSVTGLSLQACQPGLWSQLWAYDDAGDFRGVNQAKTSLSDQCISSAGSYTTGAVLTVQTCGWFTWTPEATVGAGAAGPGTQQLVNYGEYGRCLDVTEWNVNAAWLIDYPCKQDPTSSVGWNQRWAWDGAGTRQIVTNSSSGPYCLTTPPSSGGYVLVRPCDGNRTDQKWTMYSGTGLRSTSYTVVDDSGRCLSLGPPGPASNYLSAWSSITADPCDGSFRQKWNSPPLPFAGTLSGERETTGGR